MQKLSLNHKLSVMLLLLLLLLLCYRYFVTSFHGQNSTVLPVEVVHIDLHIEVVAFDSDFPYM